MDERISGFAIPIFVVISEVEISDFRGGKQGGSVFTEFSNLGRF